MPPVGKLSDSLQLDYELKIDPIGPGTQVLSELERGDEIQPERQGRHGGAVAEAAVLAQRLRAAPQSSPGCSPFARSIGPMSGSRPKNALNIAGAVPADVQLCTLRNVSTISAEPFGAGLT